MHPSYTLTSQRTAFPFLKAATPLNFSKRTTAAGNTISPFQFPKNPVVFFLRGDRFSFQFRCRCKAPTAQTGVCVCTRKDDNNNNNKNNNNNNNEKVSCQGNQEMSLWFAEGKYLKFKPCTMLCQR